MDGGGRFSESLNAPAASGRARLTRLRLPRVLRRFTAARRLRPAVPIEARVPRHLGTPLLAGTLAVVALSGFVASGRYDAFVAENGRPLDVLARLAGFGVEKVTISGISRMYEREVLHLAYYQDLTQREIAERLAVPIGTVKARAARGTRRLAIVMRENGGDR